MQYGGNPCCSYCCTDEHERCLGVWATQDQRYWFECGCERCEARECAAYDPEKPTTKRQMERTLADCGRALEGAIDNLMQEKAALENEEKPLRVITFKVSEETRAVLGLDAIDAKRARGGPF